MKKINRFTLFLFSFLALSASYAQKAPPYSFHDLSNFSYKEEKDSIKKSWACPELYKQKATQNEFKEMWNSRTDFLINSIEANVFIRDNEIYNYINQIILDIARSNTQLVKKIPLLIIDRSSAVNAYSIGNSVVIVNMGMITFSQSREELALAIAHELSHDILKHAENAMQERAVLLTSEEYKNSLEEVLHSKYERLTKLKKIIAGYSFSRSRHNRYHEGEADSLAIVLLRNSKISFNPEFFLRLDSADNQYKQELNKPVKDYFGAYNLDVEDNWFIKRTKGLSLRNYNFKDSTANDDSLRTHPDCRERYNNTKHLLTSYSGLTPIPEQMKEKANKILIWNMFNDQNLTPCLYRILLEKDKGNTDSWYDFMAYNVLAGLYYSTLQLNRFNAIGIKSKEYVSARYIELQNMLEQIPAENLEQLNKQMVTQSFWANLPDDMKELRTLMNAIISESRKGNKKNSAAAREFLNNHPGSMYCEFADHFKN